MKCNSNKLGKLSTARVYATAAKLILKRIASGKRNVGTLFSRYVEK